jgi:hypothetical protein
MAKSLLLDLKAYSADANTKRSLLSIRSATQNDNLSHNVKTLAPVMTELLTLPVVEANVITVVRTSGPVKIELTTPSGVVTLPAVAGLLVFPAHVSSMRVQNTGASAVDVIIIQQ